MTEPIENRRGFAIGDIHGCARAFSVLLSQLKLTPNDRVVVLGDAVDRGPDSRGVLDELIELGQSCELIYILGNHEEMMLEALRGRKVDDWLRHGGAETLDSYRGNLDNIPDRHIDLLNSAINYWEGPTEICIHANLEPGVALDRQRASWLRWRKLSGYEFPHESGKRIICGHSGVSFGAPTVHDGWICLDTMAYGGGILSALDLNSGEIIQARQSGEFRRGVYLHEIEA